MFISKSIYIARAGRKGRGVFAKKRFMPGDILEVSPFVEIPAKGARSLTKTIINSYWYDLDGKRSALGLGYTSLYNHADEPNAEFAIHSRRRTITIKVIKPIRKGEEITTNYGYEID